MRAFIAFMALMVCHPAAADLCAMPGDARVAVTSRTIAAPDYFEPILAKDGRWTILPNPGSTPNDSVVGHTESAVWNRTFNSRIALPASPYCRYPKVDRGGGWVEELRVYRLKGNDLPTTSADWVLDHNAGLLREVLPKTEYELLGDPSEWGGDRPVAGEASPDPVTVGDDSHYLSVATSPPPGIRFDPAEQGHFGIGWNPESHHDAGTRAVDECRGQGGTNCSFNASGTSLRGGCVGLALARWRDRGTDAERTYVVTSSSFRSLITGNLRSECERESFGGKHEGKVVEHSCEVLRIACAGDPAT